ncbi:MAG: SH3 domain-containing protein [Parasporobacterium sp.]|nr:SH3 domain-containing protein [Parasporobacterium sp.]
MLKKSLLAAVTILSVALLAACGESSQPNETAAEPDTVVLQETTPASEADTTTLAEGETTTAASDMQITAIKKADTADGAQTETTQETKASDEQAADAAPAGDQDGDQAGNQTGEQAAGAAQAQEDVTAAAQEQAEQDPAEPQQAAEDGDEDTDTAVRTGETGVVSADGDGLLLREGPDSSYDYLTIVPDGTELTIQEEQDGWGYVSFDGLEGWVSLDYVE